MAITYANATDVFSIGSKYLSIKSVALDNSYPTNGYTLTPSQFGLSVISQVFPVANESGYVFQYQTATGKMEVFVAPGGAGGTTGNTTAVNAPSAVSVPTITLAALAPHSHTMAPTVNETIAVTPGTGVSAALSGIPLGYVINVYQTAGGVTGPATIIPSTATLASQQVQIDYTTGVLTFLVADAVTQATVTYSSLNTSNTSGGTPTVTGVSAQTAAAQIQTAHNHSVGAGAGGALVEVANGTDLSAVTNLYLIAIGQ